MEEDALRKMKARAQALNVLLNGRKPEPKMSPAMREVVDDLRQNGPVMLFMGWPQRNGRNIHYRRRVTSRTWDGMESRELVEWTAKRLDGFGLVRIYEAL